MYAFKRLLRNIKNGQLVFSPDDLTMLEDLEQRGLIAIESVKPRDERYSGEDHGDNFVVRGHLTEEGDRFLATQD
jgi:hypothetical protein